MDKRGLIIGIFGGFGLGLILGVEISSSIVTLIGAIIILITLISMGLLTYKDRK